MRRFVLACTLAGFAAVSHAGLFDDEEARKAILDLRKESRDRIDAGQRETNERLDRMTRAQLDLAAQVDALRAELARIRGQLEVTSKELTDAREREKAFYVDIDTRLKRVEPRQVTVDGQSATVELNEQRMWDTAAADYKSGDYKKAAASIVEFLKAFPQSAYAPSARFMLGNAYYALRDYRAAIATHQALLRANPENPRAPDSMLTIASSQVELRDIRGARKTLESVMTTYPDTPAAKMAKERLAVLR